MRSSIRKHVAALANLKSTLLLVSAIVGVAGLVLLVVLFPQYLVNSRHMSLTSKDQLDAEAGIRSSMIQVIGGAILITGLYFTARGFRLTREGHITDRYSKAIEQLGNTNADVRIGGIYALERIARDSQSDQETIIEVLTTFVREHTRSGTDTPRTEKVTADVQAALSVIARRPNVEAETRRLDFYHSGLNDANFRSGDFRGAMFYYSRLDSAHFAGAKLDHAGLSWCNARGAAFSSSSARGANFVNAKFADGWFLGADLTDADFYGCDLTGSDFGRRYTSEGDHPLPPAVVANARFTNATLKNTNLRGVDLHTVRGLTAEQLEEAITDMNTVPPERWGTNSDDD